jgi:hypothetical protein
MAKAATAMGAGVVCLLVAPFIAACGSSSEPASVPSNSVAVVEDAPDGTISKADFDAALTRAAGSQGLPKAPAPSSPQYRTLRDTAMSAVLLSRWIMGEAEDRGIAISDAEISSQLKQFAKQFGGQRQFQRFLKQAGYDPTQARDQVELSLITKQLKKQAVAGATRKADQKAAVERFQTDFIAKWRSRTTCAPGYVIDRCSNGPTPATTSTSNTATSPGVP